MNKLKVGFSRVNINPPLGAFVAGYFIDRFADGILDDLEASAVAFELDGKKAVIISADLCEVPTPTAEYLIREIATKTGLNKNEIFFVVTHSHTAPAVCLRDKLVTRKSVSDEMLGSSDENLKINKAYTENILAPRLADAAVLAFLDLKPAKLGWRQDKAEGLAFVRRYLMKDGTIRTNPGVGNPDIVSPVGHIDDGVTVIRIDREGGDTVVIVNYANHADTVGGCKLSADWPGQLRRAVELAIPGTKCLYLNGAEGDVGHVNVFAKDGDLNGMFYDFDDVTRGYDHSIHMGRVVAASVLRTYGKVNWVDCDKIVTRQRVMATPSNMPKPEELPEARRINELHLTGRDAELPYEGMMLTTVVAEASRMIALEHGPEHINLTLTALRLGPIAIIGIPGEPFTGVGEALKRVEGFAAVLPASFANGYEGYFPMMSSYEEGGYEARSSVYRAGVAEKIISECTELLLEVKK